MKKAVFLILLLASMFPLVGLPIVYAQPEIGPLPTYISTPSNKTFIIPINMTFNETAAGYFSAVFYWDNDENDSNAPYWNFTYEGFRCWFTDGTNFSVPISVAIYKQVPVGKPAGYYRYIIAISETAGEPYNGDFWLNITMRAAGVMNGSYTPHFGWDQDITISKVRCNEDSIAPPKGPVDCTIHVTPKISSCDSTGAPKELFNATLGEAVYVKGYGFSNSTAGTTTRIYVVENTTWTDNQTIGPDVRGAYSIADVDSIGNLNVTNLGLLSVGEYDIVADASMDGFYNVTTDAVDDPTSLPGLTVTEVAIHDVAIVSVSPFPTVVFQGQVVNVTVVAKNEGNLREDFNVTAYYNDKIGKQAVTNLAPGANTTLIFNWNTTDVPPGNYTISANATVVLGETDTADNTYIDGNVTVLLPQFHDVATISITPSFPRVGLAIVTEAYPTWTININVTVKNEGDFIESFTVEVFYGNATGNYTLGTKPVTNLALGANTTLTFEWDLSGLDFFTYALSANASLVNDHDPADNYLVDGTVKVKCVGDVNGDGSVSMIDLNLFDSFWYTIVGYPQYDPRADFNGDGQVNITDVIMLGKNWHKGPLD